jgi:NCS1 family nucleobase:cation symporter-1
MMNAIPLVLNGLIGAKYHIPFPIVARASFGFYFARFAIIVRMITAVFWHGIQAWTGSLAMFQIIRSIWPSFLDIPNHLPASAGITTNQMIAHFVFFCVQFPILLTPPHKLRFFFAFKTLIVLVVCTTTVIVMVRKAGGIGDIWNQEYSDSGSARTWKIIHNFSAQCGGWATMATNVPDFTRYMRRSRGVYWQALILPSINLLMSVFGVVSTSCAKVVYGSYIWSPLELAAQWDGPGGRCGAFFVGLCWVIAQIGTNLSASVIPCANDMTNLFPKYINIRRGAIITTFTSCWIIVPWKIVYSASSLLTFMSGLAIFLAPIAALIATDYWLVKKRNLDVPSLYRRHGRYRYYGGCNWRAVIAFLVAMVPNAPGLAAAVNSRISITSGIQHVYDWNYCYGFFSAVIVYYVLNLAFPDHRSLIDSPIVEDVRIYNGIEVVNTGVAVEPASDLFEKKMTAEVAQSV